MENNITAKMKSVWNKLSIVQKLKDSLIEKEEDMDIHKYYVVRVNDHEHGRTQNYTISVSRIDDDGTRDD